MLPLVRLQRQPPLTADQLLFPDPNIRRKYCKLRKLTLGKFYPLNGPIALEFELFLRLIGLFHIVAVCTGKKMAIKVADR